MRNPSPTLSCVVPAYNEAHNLPHLVSTLLDELSAHVAALEIVVIDDGSRDDTPRVMDALQATHPEVRYIRLSRNFGKEAALSAGLDHARGDAVVLLDADGQHPPALVRDMLASWQQGHDVVYTVRRSRDDQSPLHAAMVGGVYRLINWRSRFHIPHHAGDFRLMDRKVVQALRSMPERNRFMKGLYAWVGFSSTALLYDPLPRRAGQSHFGLGASLSLALTGLVSFSTAPLRMVSWLGLGVSAAALLYGLWVVAEYFLWGIEVPGYATIVAGMMLLSGVQLLSMGVLAEYLGRIYAEVKQRPNYLVATATGQGLPPVKSADDAP